MKVRLMTINVDGLQEPGSFANFLHAASGWVREGVVDAIGLQEHNLHPDRDREIRRLAMSKGFAMAIAYAPEGGRGVHWGGTMILLNEKTLTLKTVDHPPPHHRWYDRGWTGRS